MIPSELLYSLIGLAGAFVAHRLGIPILGPKTPTPVPVPPPAPAPTPSTTPSATPVPSDVSTLVRQALLDILKGINQPSPATDDAIRQHIQAIATDKKS